MISLEFLGGASTKKKVEVYISKELQNKRSKMKYLKEYKTQLKAILKVIKQLMRRG